MKIYEIKSQDSIHYVTSKRAAELMGKRGLGEVREIEFDLTKKGIAEMLNGLGLAPWADSDKPGAIRITANKPPEPDPDYDDEPDQFNSDAEADADALASAGFGTDEDYGHFGDDE